MIEQEVASILESRVMILVSTPGMGARPTIGRATGARFNAAIGQVELLVSASQWPEVSRYALPGRKIASTYVRPSDYRAYQIKGVIAEVCPANAEEAARGTRYVEDMLEEMRTLGVSRIQLSSTLCDRDLQRIRFWPTDLFAQTPGPLAGQRLPMGEPR
ncbi:hypothetical protein [Rhizobium alvei]|jgi:hypothetical protein|uniref:Uncharacterized protein n=1 Tax=Rhizobium alvei TaxID=1132659 RepID=A0ABT8YMH1_9HYPH|nr:hypothetical protein [Rhizobium alvei]MDO6964796.1 hypothetical protein [Rhizobium alvei]